MSSIKINSEFIPIESGDGYIKYSDGTMICYGETQVTYRNENYLGGSTNFPKVFTNKPVAIITRIDGDNSLNNTQYNAKITNISEGSIGAFLCSYNGGFTQGTTKTLEYIAIGK